MIKKIVTRFLLAFAAVPAVQAATSVKTSIDVQAEISTSVRIYVDGRDVTNGAISLVLENQGGYMTARTPAFHFIGNANSVGLRFNALNDNDLISENNDRMKINTTWITPDGAESATSFPVYNQQVYPNFSDVPDPQRGVRVNFVSAQRSETYPLGRYSGTLEVLVTPSV